MPIPKRPPHNPLPRKVRLPPELARLQAYVSAAVETERMTQLVDYLGDLRREFDAVAAELKMMGFCTPCYLSELDDGSDHDCVDAD